MLQRLPTMTLNLTNRQEVLPPSEIRLFQIGKLSILIRFSRSRLMPSFLNRPIGFRVTWSQQGLVLQWSSNEMHWSRKPYNKFFHRYLRLRPKLSKLFWHRATLCSCPIPVPSYWNKTSTLQNLSWTQLCKSCSSSFFCKINRMDLEQNFSLSSNRKINNHRCPSTRDTASSRKQVKEHLARYTRLLTLRFRTHLRPQAMWPSRNCSMTGDMNNES